MSCHYILVYILMRFFFLGIWSLREFGSCPDTLVSINIPRFLSPPRHGVFERSSSSSVGSIHLNRTEMDILI